MCVESAKHRRKSRLPIARAYFEGGVFLRSQRGVALLHGIAYVEVGVGGHAESLVP